MGSSQLKHGHFYCKQVPLNENITLKQMPKLKKTNHEHIHNQGTPFFRHKTQGLCFC
jgi:hypothetical protein